MNNVRFWSEKYGTWRYARGECRSMTNEIELRLTMVEVWGLLELITAGGKEYQQWFKPEMEQHIQSIHDALHKFDLSLSAYRNSRHTDKLCLNMEYKELSALWALASAGHGQIFYVSESADWHPLGNAMSNAYDKLLKKIVERGAI